MISRIYKSFSKVKFDMSMFAKKHKQKNYNNWVSKKYNFNPTISFIIQTHNKYESIILLMEKLRKCNDSEILIIDDGSELKYSKKILNNINNSNEFYIKCNDLYEVITYDRAIYYSRGKYAVLLQDDDDFKDLDWAYKGLELLNSYCDSMVILGGRDAMKLVPYDVVDGGEMGEYYKIGNIGGRNNCVKYEIYNNTEIGSSFKFVQTVNRAPMWINRDLFLQTLKNIDQSYAPILVDDKEICLRAWLNGLKVGWYDAGFHIQGLGKGGMRIWNNDLLEYQSHINYKKLYSKYSSHFDEINASVERANRDLL